VIPLLPPHSIADLAREHLTGANIMPPRYPIHDPDGFLAPNLSPPQDPVYMGLMVISRTGPIGAFRRWIERRIDAREDRLYGARLQDILPPSMHTDRPGSGTLDDLRVRSDRDIAA
jgi:hypothetical protein